MPAKPFSWTEYMSAWNTANVDRILDCYAEDCEVIGATPSPVRGKAELRRSLEAYFRSFSEVNGDAQVLVASGEYVAALVEVTAQQTGPLEIAGKSVPATNKRVQDRLAVFLLLNHEGRIAREWDVTNQLSTFQQLGVPPPAIAAGGSPARP